MAKVMIVREEGAADVTEWVVLCMRVLVGEYDGERIVQEPVVEVASHCALTPANSQTSPS